VSEDVGGALSINMVNLVPVLTRAVQQLDVREAAGSRMGLLALCLYTSLSRGLAAINARVSELGTSASAPKPAAAAAEARPLPLTLLY